jgi:hypothetical protein
LGRRMSSANVFSRPARASTSLLRALSALSLDRTNLAVVHATCRQA